MKNFLFILWILISVTLAEAAQPKRECPSLLKLRGLMTETSPFQADLQLCQVSDKNGAQIELVYNYREKKKIHLSKEDWASDLAVIQQEYDSAEKRSKKPHPLECTHPISVQITLPGKKLPLSFVGCEGPGKKDDAWWSAQRLHDLARHLYLTNGS